jgi:hypothetical protein
MKGIRERRALPDRGRAAAEAVLRSEGADQGVSRSFTDRAGNHASATVSGISIDKTPPSSSCGASPAVLQPPSGRLVPVEVALTLNDALSGASGFRLVSASSSEGEATLGAGDRPGDISGFKLGGADTSGALRAERAGAGSGRVYTLEYEGAVRAGNVVRCNAQVNVPHDSGRGPGGEVPRPERPREDACARVCGDPPGALPNRQGESRLLQADHEGQGHEAEAEARRVAALGREGQPGREPGREATEADNQAVAAAGASRRIARATGSPARGFRGRGARGP